MQPQREAITNSLAEIIRIIHFGGKNGTLTVERGQERIVEEGLIIFVEGRIAEARVGQQSGMAAFNYLKTWTTCRFSFIDYPSRAVSLPQQFLQTTRPLKNILPMNASTLAQQNGRENEYKRENEHEMGSAMLSTYPVRLQAGAIALQNLHQMQMSRIQKRVLLLINGQRSLNDLARLTARSPEEVKGILNELEQAGLIHQ